MAPQSGNPPSYTAAPAPDTAQRLADVQDRLSTAMENAATFVAFGDPLVVVELRDVLGEVLELFGDRPGCRYSCEERGFRCPITEPLERAADRMQASGWIASWDAVEARLGHDMACLCGSI